MKKVPALYRYDVATRRKILTGVEKLRFYKYFRSRIEESLDNIYEFDEEYDFVYPEMTKLLRWGCQTKVLNNCNEVIAELEEKVLRITGYCKLEELEKAVAELFAPEEVTQ